MFLTAQGSAWVTPGRPLFCVLYKNEKGIYANPIEYFINPGKHDKCNVKLMTNDTVCIFCFLYYIDR